MTYPVPKKYYKKNSNLKEKKTQKFKYSLTNIQIKYI